MKLIVGLGNPGKEYDSTRHNMGFEIIDAFAKSKNLDIKQDKFGGLYTEFIENNEKIILLKPQKYINLSGEVIKKYVDYFKIDLNDILIISDDLDLPFGTLRLREKGSSGGHNGLKNIELNLGTSSYKRLKIGISNNKDIDTKDYVLGKFSSLDREIVDNSIDTSLDILDEFLSLDFNVLMSKYNK